MIHSIACRRFRDPMRLREGVPSPISKRPGGNLEELGGS